jgi:hypothetical protein
MCRREGAISWRTRKCLGALPHPPARSAELARKGKPSWYLVATDDRMIPPAAQCSMAKRANATVAEAKGSYAIYVSQPKAVADFIEMATMSLSVK